MSTTGLESQSPTDSDQNKVEAKTAPHNNSDQLPGLDEVSLQNAPPVASGAPKPGNLYVCKRDGVRVDFDPKKINLAITKAMIATEGGQMARADSIHEKVEEYTREVVDRLKRSTSIGGVVHIEDIQDQVELCLMRKGEQKVARSYVIYREERARERKENQQVERPQLHITLTDGSQVKLESHAIHQMIDMASRGIADIDHNLIYEQCINNIYDGITYKDLIAAQIMTCHTLVERDPDYGYVASRLLLNSLVEEANQVVGFTKGPADLGTLADSYPAALEKTIRFGVEKGFLDSKLIENFDLQKLGAVLDAERDYAFDYLGMRTLYDRYFQHYEEKRFELPQVFFMRVAMGLAIEEDKPTERAIEFYSLLSSFDFMSSTPTLFNSGTVRSQLSSCYLTTVPDDLNGIFNAIHENAMLSKWAGGLGNDWTPVRAMSSRIKGTNGKSQGVVPFLKVVNDTAVAVNQGGKRKGAVCVYLETWHLDIEQFLELRKNTGDDRRRAHDMNTANWVPDLFLQRVIEDGQWTLFSPDDVPDLHDLYGQEFARRYAHYEEQAEQGAITNYKRIPAKQLWRKMLVNLFETGHPWITYKDACNIRSPQQHCGTVHSSNLCTEITLNTSDDEIAVCNLGSVNLVQHLTDQGKLDTAKLKKTVTTAIRMLDNVIDINYYSVEKARTSNLRHRPIGLGLMGFHDTIIKQGVPYASDEAVNFADYSMEHLSYYAIEASAELAKERGSYKSFEGSLWSKGMVPLDSIELLREQRGGKYLEVDTNSTLDWDSLRNKVKEGMRNSNVMAIAPTATIGNITGVSRSIDPVYQNLFVSTNLSGDFINFNKQLVVELKQRGLWDVGMINDLKYYDGDVSRVERIPEELRPIYATAMQIHPKWLIEAASRRQKWLDQAQSLNLFMPEPNGALLDQIYRMAWFRGLKTTYYLKSLGATSVEKSTVNDAKLNKVAVNNNTTPMACSLDGEDCEACQ